MMTELKKARLTYMDIIISLIIAVIGGGAIFSFIQFLIQRKDNKFETKIEESFNRIENRIDKLETGFADKFNSLDRKIDDVEANNARIRILHFSEEIQRGEKHSKEAFDQVHADIDSYRKHCTKYPDYPNSRSDDAITIIEKIYLKAMQLQAAGEEGFLS